MGLELTYPETAAERERAAMAAYATFEQGCAAPGEPRRLDGRERGLVRALMFQSPDRSWVVNEYRELDRPC